MMTGRERVRRCVEFDYPDRVPRDLWLLPVASIEHGDDAIEALQRRWPTDFDGPAVGSAVRSPLTRGDPYAPGTYQDDWGCEFVNIHPGVIGQVKRPLIDEWSKLEKVRAPVEALEVDVDAVNRACATKDRFVMGGCCPRPFERLQFLRGSEDLYLDLADPPAPLYDLLKLIHDFYCKEFEVWAGSHVDGLTFMDDWGSQEGLLISPNQWRCLFKPLYADYVRIAHDAGKKIFMHSDGHIFDIYEDLIEIGVDAVNSQLFCMDIEQIGRRFARRITFWGEMDRQQVLALGTSDDARAAVERVAVALHRPEGGVIAQFELGAGAKLENADAIFQVWKRLGAGVA